ncbi:MAG: right-handed parallel beta-helix repeat-containing protein, partial [Rhodospirillales bacterium]|nr:right-handed parallel beta-helix repeat-containing protein [Rhodospirillales bacterium]
MMRRTFRECRVAFLGLLAILMLFPLAGHGQVPQTISYQGSLTDSAGNPVSGSFDITFSLYDAATAGSLLWTETQTVTVTNGAFNAVFGTNTGGNPLDPTVFENQTYLGVAVAPDTEMTPRQALSAAGYGIRAKTVEVDTLNALSCTGGEVAKWNGTVWACAADADTADTTLSEAEVEAFVTDGAIDLSAGTTLGGAAIQTGSESDTLGGLGCAGGQVAKWTGAAWACAADIDTDTDTLYVAGAGLTLSGTTFAVDNSGITSAMIAPSAVTEGKLNFDTATQAELDSGLAGIGPHVTSVDGLLGGTISSGVSVTGTMSANDVAVSSTTLVANLNADQVDGLQAAEIIDAASDEVRMPISALPFTISAPGSYYLTGDLTLVATNTTGITVNADNVTIDLMGFSMIGPGGAGSGAGISMSGRTNVEVRNGTVRDFRNSGIVELSGAGQYHRLLDLRVVSNGATGIHLASVGNLIRDCTVSGNGNNGITAGVSATAIGNTASNNSQIGIFASSGTSLIGNTVYNNGSDGIRAGNGATVTRNSANGNGGVGIQTNANSATLSENSAYDNVGDGFDIGPGSAAVGNVARANGANGFTVGVGATVTSNTAYLNQNDGINLLGDSLVNGNTAFNNNQSLGGFANMSAC